MNAKDVKLTLKEEAIVVINWLYETLPWRYLIFIVGGFLSASMNLNCGCGPVIGWLMPGILGGLVGFAVAGFFFAFIPAFWRECGPNIKKSYSTSRQKTQKKLLDQVDDQLLK